jgi:ectoine hydroxylase-related dioxygenase (phytanoyl-CoA dioxygenase family)
MPMADARRAARRLSAKEREAYERDGYVVVSDVFPPHELEAIDRELDRLIDQPGVAAGPNRRGWIYDVAGRSAITRRFAEDARLVALVEDMVYPGLAIHSSKLVTKEPRSADVCHWHQDEAFYLTPEDSDTHSRRRMSVWVPLQEATERNGCLWVVPGSHKWGLEGWVWQDEGTCQKRITRHEYAERHATAIPACAGAAVLFTAWTWHHSKNNCTDGRRRAFIVSYQEATVAKGAGQQLKILRPAS